MFCFPSSAVAAALLPSPCRLFTGKWHRRSAWSWYFSVPFCVLLFLYHFAAAQNVYKHNLQSPFVLSHFLPRQEWSGLDFAVISDVQTIYPQWCRKGSLSPSVMFSFGSRCWRQCRALHRPWELRLLDVGLLGLVQGKTQFCHQPCAEAKSRLAPGPLRASALLSHQRGLRVAPAASQIE